eukprot:3444343-Rhodomonas_salina.1
MLAVLSPLSPTMLSYFTSSVYFLSFVPGHRQQTINEQNCIPLGSTPCLASDSVAGTVLGWAGNAAAPGREPGLGG